MLDRENLIALAKTVAKADPSAPIAYSFNGQSLSYAALNETLRLELDELTNTREKYETNKYKVFALIEQVLTDVLPRKVEDRYSNMAEVKVFKQGDKPIFKRKLSNRRRVGQFITRVGLAGVYEVCKLAAGVETFEVPTSAIGGAVQIGIEEFLDKRVDFNELLNLAMEYMDELVYKEGAHALRASVNQLPQNNYVIHNGFSEQDMDTLVEIASAYGTPTIYCTREFAVKMIPQQAWRYTEDMKDQLWKRGYFADYKGTRVIILDQGFEDETNSRKVIDPGYAWVIPTGADSKPIKIAFEGDMLVDERKNHDWSRDVQFYQKVGVVAMLANNICCYCDTSLVGHMTTWNFAGYATVADYGQA